MNNLYNNFSWSRRVTSGRVASWSRRLGMIVTKMTKKNERHWHVVPKRSFQSNTMCVNHNYDKSYYQSN